MKAVEIYKQNSDIDTICMDIRMPNMDGIAATKLIREFEQTNHIEPANIIAVTAYNDYDSECEKAGFDELIRKPVLKDELMAKVNPNTTN